jgi:iron complex transport system substrate-binding protein
MKSLAVALLLLTAAAAAEPQRIVSANLCADRLVTALADPDKVISLSYHAADPLLSTVLERARTVTLNHADAEEIAAMHPDLVIFGQYSFTASAQMLKGLGIPVHILPVPNNLAEVKSAIRDLASVLGVPQRGEAMVRQIEDGLARLSRPRRQSRAVIYSAGGWTYGAHSLDDDILQSLGAVNVATLAGIDGIGNLSLEQLVALDPQLVIIEAIGDAQPSLAAQLLDHPVLAGTGIKRLAMPMKLWQCQDVALVEAARLIDEALP